MKLTTRLLHAAAVTSLWSYSCPAQAQDHRYDIPAQPASSGIQAIGRATGLQIFVSEVDARGLRIAPVRGTMSPKEALRTAIQGSGLIIVSDDGRTIVLKRGESRKASAADTASTDANEIVVTASVYQGRKDIQARRASAVIVDTLTQDDIGALPDRTIADSLRRITGVTTHNNDYIGQFVSVRGISPDQIAVTFDGITLATVGENGIGRRHVNLQIIPARAVQQIQAFKSFTPDLESGAVGGLINLVPASAFDYRGERMIADVSTNYSSYGKVDGVNSGGSRKRSMFGSGAELSYANRFGPDRSFGIVLNALWQQRQKDQSNDVRPGLLYLTNANTVTNPIDPSWNGVAIPNQYATLNYTNRYRTHGGSALIEYKPDDQFYMSLFGFVYVNSESETRNQTRLLSFDQVVQSSPTTGSLRVRQADTQWIFNTFERNSKGLTWHTHYDAADKGILDVRAGYTHATFRTVQPILQYQYNPNKRLAYDLTADEHYSLSDAASYLNPANYKISSASDNLLNSFEDVADMRLDYAANSDAKDRGLGVKLGAAYRHLFTRSDKRYTRYVTNGSTLSGYGIIADFDVPGSPYPVLWIDQQKVRAEVIPKLAVNSGTSALDSAAASFEYGEDVANLYGALTYSADRFYVIGGVRYDHTRSTAAAPQIIGGVLQPDYQSTRGRYQKLLPSLNGLYRFTDNRRLKFGYSRTLGRPNPNEIAQIETIDEVDYEISRGNPRLRPRVSDNLEVGIEQYFGNGDGIFTASLFAKNIRGDIITAQREEVRGGNTYMVTEPINGDESRYRGQEAGFVYNRLRFLPGQLANIGVSGNILHVKGRTTYTLNGVRTERGQLFDQMKWAGNAALFYNVKGRGEIRVAANYQGKYVDALGASPWLDVGFKPYTTFDLTARYRLTEHWNLRFQARNLLNANRGRLTGTDLRYDRANIEFGSLFMLHLTFTN